ncbi:MAG: response regulator [Elusimicrobiales bacterium]|jgi:two-component system cell cycle response regulator CpdR
MPKKVLLADDEELVRNYITRALSSRGFSVRTVDDGAAAVAAIEKEDFDVVICDLKMPDLRGEEVIKKLKALRPGAKVIVITGSVSNISSHLVPGTEVDGVLIKPFGIGEIRDLVEKITKAGS